MLSRLTRLCVVFLVVAMVGSAGSRVGAASDIHPDPSFEATGEAGVARTGERAGHLKVGRRVHWACIGGPIKVEPFARYRVAAYVKANIAVGSPFALYCYEWNSYEWAFVSNVLLKSTPDWTHVETTFISPYDHIFVHPLAFIDCENSEAWVDDIAIEKIGEPGDVMRDLMHRAERTPDENEILARYLVGKGDLREAEALMGGQRPLTQADIACLLAQHTRDRARRRPFVVHMVRSGGLGYNAGLERFNEIAKGFSAAERLAIAEDALKADPASPAAGRAYHTIAGGYLRSDAGIQTCAQADRHQKVVAASVERALAALPADAAARAEVQALSNDLDAARAELDKRRASLGHCVLRIGGETVTPKTHAIVLRSRPTPQEKHAAADLQYHLELVTGQEIPIVREARLGRRTPIAVGKCALLKKLGVDPGFRKLGLEGIYIKTAGPALILAGNKRGVLYATYTFLEDYVGCRWFTPDCSTWPTDRTIVVPDIDRHYVPPLEYRTTDYPNSRDADWAVRNKNNGTGTAVDEARGGKITYHHFVHTFNSLIPPEEYFNKHPEYFSEVNGKRLRDHTQLCLTNPEVIELAKKRVRQWIQERPDATIFSVSQNDWGNYCQCPKCTALAEEEGSQAGPLIHFVNAIADDINDDYPNVIIDTLAYQYTRKPPLHVKPRPNVAVRLCSIECCFVHPLATCPFNSSFVDDIKGWSKICNRLHIWDYVINYAHSIMPFPNLHVLKPNINFFVENGVTGIYEEANYYSKGGELAELRTYVMAKTLWDPSYDTDKAIDEFLAAYYGRAAAPMRKYINLIHDKAGNDLQTHVRIYTAPAATGYLTPEVLARSAELFDRAERAVRDDPIRLHRVQVARLPLIYSQIALAGGALYRDEGDRLVQDAGADVSALADRFAEIAKAEGVTRVREGGPQASVDAWLASVPRRSSALAVRWLRNGTLEVGVVPELGGRIWRLKHVPSGADLIKRYGSDEGWDPGSGGCEEYSQADYRSPGWNEPYAVTDQSDRALTLQADLRGGLRLTRRIELDPQKPLLHVTSTLTNVSNATRRACLRVHPAFQVVSTGKTSVRLRRADGGWDVRSLATPDDPQAEKDVWLRGDERPAGAWLIADEAADLAIVSRFEPSEVAQCLLNWNGRDGRVNLEMLSPEAELPPGGQIAMTHSYEVVRPASAAGEPG